MDEGFLRFPFDNSGLAGFDTEPHIAVLENCEAFASIHLQNVVIARMGDRRNVGVVEKIALGPHKPSGLTGFPDDPGAIG